MSAAKKLLLVGFLMIAAGYVGFWFGAQKLKLSIRDYKPTVVMNKQSVVGRDNQVDFQQFWTVWDKVQEMYVDKTVIDPKKMVDGAISGMVAAIGDPYTVYLPVQQNKESKEDLGGQFGGVGIQLGFDKDNHLAVMTPVDDSPAAKAGVKAGDLILQIKDTKAGVDKSTEGITIPEAVKLIRGDIGTKVTLTLFRTGAEKPYTVELTRDTIVVKSVTVDYNNNLAVVKLSRFGDRTQDEWNNAVSGIINHQPAIKGVVLDLRNNPGGYLEMAVYTASEFLAPGKVVVSQQYGDGSKIENKVERNGRLLNIPLVVIVNKGSASASEILAGALQDYKRAKIIGEQSFGKGSVQQPEDFPDGSGLHVTVARWLKPSGDWIDKKGITPDIEVKFDETQAPEVVGGAKLKDAQLDKAVEMLK